MAKLLGKDARYLLKATEISGDFRQISANTAVDEVEVTAFGDSAREFIAGYGTGGHDLTGIFESGASNSHAALTDLLDDTVAAVATLCPQGITSGNRACLLDASASSVEESSPGDDAVLIAASLQGGGGAKWGQILHAAAVTATGNGTGYDNPSDAATSRGAAFHLHVTVNDRNSGTLDVKIQDSADNSSFADVSGLAFTQVAAGATTSERKTIANGTSLRRYVRVVVTVTGGTTGSYTVRVAYQRNF